MSNDYLFFLNLLSFFNINNLNYKRYNHKNYYNKPYSFVFNFIKKYIISKNSYYNNPDN